VCIAAGYVFVRENRVHACQFSSRRRVNVTNARVGHVGSMPGKW
jgi:hypothetical protein